MEALLFVKSIHIVGAVAWFGGLFYFVRIFVYHIEALDKPENEQAVLLPQYELMESRVYRIICVPGAWITWIFGLAMIGIYVNYNGSDWISVNGWLHAKLFFVVLLTGYQHYCKALMRKLKDKQKPMSSFKTRLFNEVPTILLVTIVLLAVYRNTLDTGITIIGIVIFALALYFFTKLYKSIRKT